MIPCPRRCYAKVFRGWLHLMASGILLSLAQSASGQFTNKIPEAARMALEKGKHFELLSLDPDHEAQKPEEQFHHWKILGSTQITNAETRQQLVGALEKGVRENSGLAAKCFNPRHGIRIAEKDQTTDFVICFECLQVAVFREWRHESGAILGTNEGFLITKSPKPVFDKVLKSAGVRLAPK